VDILEKEVVHQGNMIRYVGRILTHWMQQRSMPRHGKVEVILGNIAGFASKYDRFVL
jgi:uncharacterized membrane protein YbaN (DUF454 family)